MGSASSTMTSLLEISPSTLYSVPSYCLIVGCALIAAVKGRKKYAAYTMVLGFVSTFISSSVFAKNNFPLFPVGLYLYLQSTTIINFYSLLHARLRKMWFRVLVTIPSALWHSTALLSLPLLAFGSSLNKLWFLVPFVVAGIGGYQSLFTSFEKVDVVLDRKKLPKVKQIALPKKGTEIAPLLEAQSSSEDVEKVQRSSVQPTRPLRLFQITDCHLGPFQSVARLRATCEEALAQQPPPDLILLTGDFFTMEAHYSENALSEALSPLKQMPGRVFACLGNHDYEALDLIKKNLVDAGADLLVEQERIVDIPEVGKVQIVGLDFYFKDAANRLKAALTALPRVPDAMRLVLLHNPSHFVHIPDGDADLVLSGHHHGGQLGFVSLGLNWTILRLFKGFKGTMDHGLWGLGTVRCYAHRGTGHYGFPLRIGVPSENSIVNVHYRLKQGPQVS